MISISKFELKFNKKEKVYYVHTLEPENAICPVCHTRLKPKGRPKRKVIFDDGKKITLKIQRYKCTHCKSFHHELPDIIVPYKRHALKTIEHIITGTGVAICEESTVSRIKAWWAAIQLYIKSILESIKERYGVDMTTVKKLNEIVRALVNTHSWPGTHSALTPGRT
jgi:uncharacterized protein YaaR (DUF327 family)